MHTGLLLYFLTPPVGPAGAPTVQHTSRPVNGNLGHLHSVYEGEQTKTYGLELRKEKQGKGNLFSFPLSLSVFIGALNNIRIWLSKGF